ncbi:MAG: methionyl-tRNA formyltransferase [Oligoflexia bacterium]|nr:methionyl-tRNA formyltransferase [Oligoflexia bacterium]
MAIRTVFLGTPEFACPTLDMLLMESETFEVVAVVTQPDRPAGRNLEVKPSRVRELTETYLSKLGKMGKKIPIISPEKASDPEFLKRIGNFEADVAVVVAYGQILPPAFMKLFKHGALNVHASLLPRWRGAAPIQWAILKEDPVTGVTLQKIAAKLDSGDVLAQSEVVLDEKWDAPFLYTELSKKGADLVRRYVPDYVAGKLKPTPQDESRVTIAPKITKEQGKIDWEKTAKEICAQIRALTPWPGTWTTREGKILKILRARPIDHQSGQKPGTVISVDKLNFVAQCGLGTALMIEVVQPESRSRMPVASYLKGYPFVRGDFLGG